MNIMDFAASKARFRPAEVAKGVAPAGVAHEFEEEFKKQTV